uniref:NADH-ubiquinone oxidoreductase chain 2 n=1 Tax=Mutinus fleischeri TaxID=2218478 RepID=A0A8K1VE66_9AGAM|nr:hypothetical protein [Mutinus fleischeri]
MIKDKKHLTKEGLEQILRMVWTLEDRIAYLQQSRNINLYHYPLERCNLNGKINLRALGLSSCIILLGVSLLYSITGLTSFDSIYNLLSVFSNSSLSILDIGGYTDRKLEIFYLSESLYQGLSLSLILIVVGFLFKIAAAPFHNWLLGPLYCSV